MIKTRILYRTNIKITFSVSFFREDRVSELAFDLQTTLVWGGNRTRPDSTPNYRRHHSKQDQDQKCHRSEKILI